MCICNSTSNSQCTGKVLHMWATAFLTSIPQITHGESRRRGRPREEEPSLNHPWITAPLPQSRFRYRWNALYRVRCLSDADKNPSHPPSLARVADPALFAGLFIHASRTIITALPLSIAWLTLMPFPWPPSIIIEWPSSSTHFHSCTIIAMADANARIVKASIHSFNTIMQHEGGRDGGRNT